MINKLLITIILVFNIINAGEIKIVNRFETWNGGIGSTDPAGICYNPNSGNLFIADSEIEEIPAIWQCENIFEVTLDGQLVHTYDAYDDDAVSCQKSASGARSIGREPAGITFNTFDGFFYVADDEEHAIIRYNASFGAPLAWLNILDTDANGHKPDLEGVTSDPNTGYLYALLGTQQEVRVYNSDLDNNPVRVFSLRELAKDPEGIAFSVQRNHLFILSSTDNTIYELTLDGLFIDAYDLHNLFLEPSDVEGITFAPTSDPNDDPSKLNLYLSDIQLDNDDNPSERDGIIYEAEITYTVDFLGESEIKITGFVLDQNYPNPFNPSTRISYSIPESQNINLEIFNLQGQLIKTLVSGYFGSGSYQVFWDGTNEQGFLVPSGLYLYRIQAGKFFQTRKMLLLK